MSETTKIQWTDHTFNPWIGCHKVDTACKNCYAEKSTPARRSLAKSLPLWGPEAHRHITGPANWKLPERWNRKSERAGVRRRVFCASLADVFEGRADLDAPRARLFDLIEATPHLDWQLLTKRPENVMRMVPLSWHRFGFPANAWIGATVGDQAGAQRCWWLVEIPAVVRFLSVEPLVERVNLARVDFHQRPKNEFEPDVYLDALRGHVPAPDDVLPHRIDWVIIGGESGPSARPCHVDWIRDVVRQCREAEVPVFVKQLGANYTDEINGVGGAQSRPDPTIVPPIARLTHPKGGDIEEFPADLRIRQFPSTEEVRRATR